MEPISQGKKLLLLEAKMFILFYGREFRENQYIYYYQYKLDEKARVDILISNKADFRANN